MKAVTALAAVALAAVSAALPAATTFMPVADIRPGMIGIGRTVFAGAEREEFRAHILGVLHNVVAPRRDLILARLEGGPLAQTGVIEGMSGSPIYIDGRLIGAVSYSLGAFPKEPIAGITPIGEMLEAAATLGPRAAVTRPRLELPVTPESLASALRVMSERVRPFADRPGDVAGVSVPGFSVVDAGLQLRPIGTPLVVGGFDGVASATLRDAFGRVGFTPTASEARGGIRAQTASTLQPGDAVGVSLVRGDFELGATGTVTHVDGSRLYAFGHAFFNLGPTAFPMTRAHVYSLLPSLMISSKITALGEVLGTVEQDRATAIAGTIGAAPRLIPMTLRLESEREAPRTLSYELVNDEFFTPLLTYLTTASTLAAYERQLGTATFGVTATARIAGHPPLIVDDVFAGPDALAAAATAVAGPVTALMSNPFESVRFERVEVALTAAERPRTATLERVWVDETRPRAGATITVHVLVRLYGGEEQVHHVRVPLPSNDGETVTLLVADGTQLAQWEQRELRRQEHTLGVDQLVRRLNAAPRRSQVYVRLIGSAPGALVNGEPLTSLPPSVMAVLDAERAGGRVVPLRSAILGAWDVPIGSAVTGARTLLLTLEPAR